VSGNDANVGGSSGAQVAAVKTMAEVVRRYGSDRPQIPSSQSLKLHFLSSQTLNVDAFNFDPRISGAGNFVPTGGTTGTGTKVGNTFSPTGVTAKAQTTAGAPLQLTFGSLPAGIAVGQIIQNVTLGSFATVYSIVATTVSVTQPLTGATLTTVTPFPVFDPDVGERVPGRVEPGSSRSFATAGRSGVRESDKITQVRVDFP
jgi:hypothetical protein